MKWFAGIFLFLPILSCELAADDGCTNAVPAVVWSSRSGLGPFKEVRRASYESAGWLKWFGEKHNLRCDICIEGGEPYVFAIDVPCNAVHARCGRGKDHKVVVCRHEVSAQSLIVPTSSSV